MSSRNIDKQAVSSASESISAHLCSRSCLHERPPRPTPMFSVEGVGKGSRAPRPNFFYTSRASTNPNPTKHQKTPFPGTAPSAPRRAQRVRPQSPGWGWGVRVNNGLFRSGEFDRPTTSARLSGCFKHHSMQTGRLYTVYIGCHPRNIDKQAVSSASESISAHLCSRSCLHERPPRPTPMFSVEGVGKGSRAPRPNFFYTSRASTNPNPTKHQKTPFPGTAPSAPRRAQRVRPQSPGWGWGWGVGGGGG